MRRHICIALLCVIAAGLTSPPIARAQSPAPRADSLTPSTLHDSGPMRTVRAAPLVTDLSQPLPGRTATHTRFALPTALVGLLVIGAIRQVAADKDSYPATQSTRVQHNNVVADQQYFALTRPAWQVAAAAVAPPGVARATVASQVKTTATTQMVLNGIVKSLTATDNLWTLTGGNLAAGSVRRYLLLWDGTTATTVATVMASGDLVIANYASAALALAACVFPSLPPQGTGIVGILSIVNLTNPFIPATTLLSAAGVTDTYVDGPDASCFSAAQITP